MEGSGKKLRHIKMHSLADTERPEARALIAAALAERSNALGR